MKLLHFLPLANWPQYSANDILAVGLLLLFLGGAALLGGRKRRG